MGLTSFICGSQMILNTHKLNAIKSIKDVSHANQQDYVYTSGNIKANAKRLLTSNSFKYYSAIDMRKTTKSYKFELSKHYLGINKILKHISYDHFKVPFSIKQYTINLPFASNFPSIINTWYVNNLDGYNTVTTSSILEGSNAFALGKLKDNIIESYPGLPSFVTHQTINELASEYNSNINYYKIVSITSAIFCLCSIGGMIVKRLKN